MRVAISGGGIAGLTLAYWLHHYHIQSVVIEQAQQIRRDGYGMDFCGTGYDVAERMGIIDQLRAQQAPFEAFVYVNASGKLVAKMDITLIQKITGGKYMGLMRWTLAEVLYQALANQVEVRFGRSLTRIESGPDAVDVTFNDGTSETFDLLIGADGVHSNTRALIFGPEEQYSHYLGCAFASYPLADRYGIGHTWTMCIEPNRLSGAYCSNQEGQLITFLMYRTMERKRLTREERLPRLRQAFAGMGWITRSLLADAPEPERIFMDTAKQIQMPFWHRGRVALVGDACDCPTFATGQGASLAMGGAYLLAEALHETTDYQEAFRRYEQRMRPYVLEQQTKGRSMSKSFLPSSPLGLLFQRTMINLFMRERFVNLLRREFGVQSILSADSLQNVRQEGPAVLP